MTPPIIRREALLPEECRALVAQRDNTLTGRNYAIAAAAVGGAAFGCLAAVLLGAFIHPFFLVAIGPFAAVGGGIAIEKAAETP